MVNSHRLTLPVLSLGLLVLLSSLAAAQTTRVLRLDDAVEAQIETGVVYVSVVYRERGSGDTYIESGTGWFVNDQIIVTNHHVIESALTAQTSKVEVTVFSGTAQSKALPVEIIKADEDPDLALLRIKAPVPGTTPLQINPDHPAKQSEVYAFGFPLGTMLDRSSRGPNVSLRRGYVSRLLDDGKYVEADVNIDKGVSGGPMVSADGAVCGVVRAIAGSSANHTYAGIAISTPVLVEFLKANGCRFTVQGGRVVEPGTPLPPALNLNANPGGQPRQSAASESLRAFFAVGSELRLNTLVPRALAKGQSNYDAEILRTSQSTIASLIANMGKINVPINLRNEAKALAALLATAKVQPGKLADRADALEQACDEWVKSVDDLEKSNYDFGAWLTELSVGAIDTKLDVPSVERFLREARDLGAPKDLVEMLDQLQRSLTTLAVKDTPEMRQSIRKQADRVMAIGYMAAAAEEAPAPAVPPAATPQGERNPIRVTIP